MIRTVITDIEGTTTALDFVHQVLFPYARLRLEAFVHEHRQEPKVAAALQLAAQTIQAEKGFEPILDQTVSELLAWADADRKHGALKTLQGIIWRHGYLEREFKGHVYPDVPEVLAHWHAGAKTLGVYSSGSVEAQKLLFAHTHYGDLTHYFNYYFDTSVGGKKETDSYRAIAAEIGGKPEELLFLSDVPDELKAAREAGWKTAQLLRPGTKPDSDFPGAADFYEVQNLLGEGKL